MSKPPDFKEREKIVRQLDTTMLVEAAAGTGKTTSMVNRMVALIAAGKCRIEEIAAVTFTRKAAAELEQRFREALQTKPELTSARAHVERCFIGTVHSFCARLLRERPVEAGLDPAFEELDEERDGAVRDRAWQQCCNELFAADDPVLDTLDELGLQLADLRAAFLAFANYPDVDEWPVPPSFLPALKPVVAALNEYIAHMRRVNVADAGNDKLLPLYRRIPAMARARDFTRHADVAEVLEQFKEDVAVVQKQWPGGKEQALAEQARFVTFAGDVAKSWLTAWRVHRYGVVLELLQHARTVYDRQRAAARGLNFQDLLMRAATLLRERPEIRRYFRRRFTHLLVDEFQDTDPVQAEVMLLLTADDPSERDWRKCRPVPGALFVVGDPMQSIYRFRRADIVTYHAVKDIILCHGGKCVALTANFRSDAPVLEWVNATFAGGAFFPAHADEFSPSYRQFQVTRAATEDTGVWKLPVADGNQADIAKAEADCIARHVARSGAAFGDFMIITRQKARLSVYADALERLGIAHEVTGGTALNEVPELAALHTVLLAMTRPEDPVALLAVLRGEVFGLNDQQLFAFHRAGGQFDYRTGADVPEVAEVFARLQQFAQWLSHGPPLVAVERIADDLGLPASAAGAPGGNARAGGFCKALGLLHGANPDFATVANVVAQLGRLVEKDEQYDSLPAVASAASAVRVMNLHKAKGLEAPVVFLADPSGEAAHPVTLHIDRQHDRVRGYLAVYGQPNAFGKAPLLAHPADWEAHAAREEQFQAAERNRLLYVAATRAGRQLIVAGRATGKKTDAHNPWQPLADRLRETFADPGPPAGKTAKAGTLSGKDVAAALADITARWQATLAPTYAVRAAKQVSLPGPLAVGDRDETAGMRWGGVIHTLLQAARRSPAADLAGLATAALREAQLDEALRDEALAVVRSVTGATLWQRASAARQRLTEVPFVVTAADGALVRGVIDLAFEETDGWVIVDYKTDKGSGERWRELTETYRPQVLAYRAAWEQALGLPVKETGLYFISANRYVKL